MTTEISLSSQQVETFFEKGPLPVLPEVGSVKLLVVGELVLDRYVMGTVSRISPEAPIPVLAVSEKSASPGNAGFVALTLSALGAKVAVASVVGADGEGESLLRVLAGADVNVDAVVVDTGRPTIVKQRFLGSVQSAGRATQQLLRVDEEDLQPLTSAVHARLCERVREQIATVDGVLISDLNKGLLDSRLLNETIQQAKEKGVPVVVDPRLGEDFSIYHGATAVTPNRYEAQLATGIKLDSVENWRRAAHRITEELDLEMCLITLDRDGAFLARRNARPIHVSAGAKEVYDVTGAGDVALAVFGLMLAARRDPIEAVRLANFIAGLEIQRLGAAVITRSEVERASAEHEASGTPSRKILPLDSLRVRLDEARKKGLRIVFTNGCFDLLHSGHIRSLAYARSLGDVLVVGVNSDRAVRELKGNGRPVYREMDRAEILAALEAVNYVTIFDDTRAEGIVRAVAPDVLVKGAEYQGQRVDGAEFVESRGGKVVFAPMLDGRSTSQVVQKIARGEQCSRESDS